MSIDEMVAGIGYLLVMGAIVFVLGVGWFYGG